jgi:hypothetical protein
MPFFSHQKQGCTVYVNTAGEPAETLFATNLIVFCWPMKRAALAMVSEVLLPAARPDMLTRFFLLFTMFLIQQGYGKNE